MISDSGCLQKQRTQISHATWDSNGKSVTAASANVKSYQKSSLLRAVLDPKTADQLVDVH